MPHLATVSPKFQISLPKALRERLGLRPGDRLYVEERDGNLVLTPATTIPRDQLYFWTRRWQEGELAVERDIRAGRVSRAYRPSEIDVLAAEISPQPAKKRVRGKTT